MYAIVNVLKDPKDHAEAGKSFLNSNVPDVFVRSDFSYPNRWEFRVKCENPILFQGVFRFTPKIALDVKYIYSLTFHD